MQIVVVASGRLDWFFIRKIVFRGGKKNKKPNGSLDFCVCVKILHVRVHDLLTSFIGKLPLHTTTTFY